MAGKKKNDIGPLIDAAAEEVLGMDLFPHRGLLRVPEIVSVTPDLVRQKLVYSVETPKPEDSFHGKSIFKTIALP